MAIHPQILEMVPGQIEEIYLQDENGFELVTPWGILVPKIVVKCEKSGNGKRRIFVFTEELYEFCYTSWELGIATKVIEDFIYNNIGMYTDVFDRVINKDKERFEKGRQVRFNRMKDEIESAKYYQNIPKTPEEIQYARSITTAKLMIAARCIPEYREKREEKIDLTSNIAQIIIPEKE